MKTDYKSEGKWTKGPWTILPEEVACEYIRIRGTNLGRKYKIANVLAASMHDGEETRANAHLIAAAPALFEALKRCEDFMTMIGIVDLPPHLELEKVELRFQNQAALALATGEGK